MCRKRVARRRQLQTTRHQRFWRKDLSVPATPQIIEKLVDVKALRVVPFGMHRLLFLLGAFHANGNYLNVLKRLLQTQQTLRNHGHVTQGFPALLAPNWLITAHSAVTTV
jgi:hypothetical protein